MALAHSKVYNFYHKDLVWTGNIVDRNQQMLFAMKEAFVAAGWTVMGSHDGSGNRDVSGITSPLSGGVDHWPTEASITKSANGNDPFVVLQCPPIMGTFQILIGNDGNSINTQLHIVDIFTSASGSFFAANGGTDGSVLVLPTAPDQVQEYGNYFFYDVNRTVCTLHVCYATDGTEFTMMGTQGMRNGALFLSFNVLDNAAPALDNDLVFFIEGIAHSNIWDASLGVVDIADHYTTAQWQGLISGVRETFYMGSIGWNNLSWASHTFSKADRSLQVTPAECFSNVRGYMGTFPDFYFCRAGSYGALMGDAVDGPPNWFAPDFFILPWDSTEPAVRRA